MRRNKGFTLIELLAVIVVLAVIALIATPIVLSLVNKAKEGAAEASAYAYVKEVETYIMLTKLNPDLPKLENGKTYEVSKIKYEEVAFIDLFVDRVYADEINETIYLNDLIDMKGDKPVSGKVTIEENSVSEAKFVVKGYNVICDKEICSGNGKSKVEEPEEEKILYKEELLNGTDPVLNENLIPVTIENDGTVKKADIYSKWYEYGNKRWANAVMLTDEGKVESDGTIKEESIKSYFVWIPRYKYKIFNLGNYTTYSGTSKPTKSNATEIQIVFENKETTVSKGNSVGSYLTHPAFTAFDTNGFWVGKFETTGTVDDITVKPGNVSLREQDVKTMFELAYDYDRNNDSHMMKNTEWGAVAYLSHSKYGINTEININNNSDYLTGHSSTTTADQTDYPGTSGKDSSVTLPYNTTTGYKASTTGNITGVYDMSGGVHEYMASYVDGSLGESGFTSDPATTYGLKYFDKYNSLSTTTSYKNRILGDATGEMGPFYRYQDGDENSRNHNNWYNDSSFFASSSTSWFYRGGAAYNGILASQFCFYNDTGRPIASLGFRVVLVG